MEVKDKAGHHGDWGLCHTVLYIVGEYIAFEYFEAFLSGSIFD